MYRSLPSIPVMQVLRAWLIAAAVVSILTVSAGAQECGDTVLEFDTVLELDLAERQGDAVIYRRMIIQFMEPSTNFTFPIKAGYQGVGAAFSNDGVGLIAVTLNGNALSEASEPQTGCFEVQEGELYLYVVAHFEAADQIEIEFSYLLRRVVTFPMTNPFEFSKGMLNFNQHFSIVPDLGMCVQQLSVTTALVFPPGYQGKLEYRFSMWPIATVVSQHLTSEPGLIVVTKTFNADGMSAPLDAGVEVSQYVSLVLPPKLLGNIYMSDWQRLEAISKIAGVLLLLGEVMLPILGFVCVRMFAGAIASSHGYPVAEIAEMYENSGVKAGDLALLRGVGMTEHTALVTFLDAITSGDVSISERRGALLAIGRSSIWTQIFGEEAASFEDAVASLAKPASRAALAADGMARLKKTNMVWISPTVGAVLAWAGWFLALAAFAAVRLEPRTAAMLDFAATAFLPSGPIVDIVTAVGAVIFLAAMSASAGSTCRSSSGALLLARVDLAAREADSAKSSSLPCLLAMAAVAQPSALFLTPWAKTAAAKLQVSEAKLLAAVGTM